MSCEDMADLIDAYVDGELSEPQRAAVARHLVDCASCARLITNREMLRSRIRAAGSHPLPAGLGARVQFALDHAVATRGDPVWFVARHPWRLLASHAGAMVIGALALFLWLSPGTEKSPVSDALSAHLRSLAATQYGPVASSETHKVRPWFAGKIDFSPPVADLAGAGFPLLGGNVDYLDGRPAAALAYGRRLHRITLFVLPAAASSAATGATSQLGYQVVHWRDETFAYWAVSDLNRRELMEFSEEFRTAVGR
jgi:anti-sigma factor RsiW